jgi:UDP-3-O-[3-hydroxymyristoyl] glucosamine N-acyltransferase
MKGLPSMRLGPPPTKPGLASVTAPEYSLERLAEIAQGQLAGAGDTMIRGVADLESAGPEDISYCVNRAYLTAAAKSRAGALIVPADSEAMERPVIRVANPYWSFAQVLELFRPAAPEREAGVSPLAYVAPTARIAEDAVVRPFAVVEEGAVVGPRTVVESGVHIGHEARVGADCMLAPHVVIMPRCVLGNRVLVHANSVIGSDGYGYATHQGKHFKIPQIGIVVIEDDVELGANVTIDRATMGRTVVGRGTKIDNLVQIGHNCEIGPDCLIVSQSGLSGSTRVGAGVRFAGQSGTVGHVSIGEHSTIAARGVVTKDLPARSFVSGFPARPHTEEKRIQVAMARLPELIKRLRAVEGKVGGKDGGQE